MYLNRDKTLLGKEAREALKKGVDQVVDAVKVTLGAMGRNVTIQNPNGSARSTKDGVSVAGSILATDSLLMIGGNMVKTAAQKAVDESGDGTTTTCILTQAMIAEGMKRLDNAANVVEIKKGIETAVKKVVEEIKKQAIPVSDRQTLVRIATISANGDQEIGEMIAEVISKVGADGIVKVAASKSNKTSVRYADGIKIDNGCISPYMLMDQVKMRSEFENCRILLYDGEMTNLFESAKFFERVAINGEPLLVICDEIAGEVLNFLALNAQEGKLRIACVKPPFQIGANRQVQMEDFAMVTGGEYVSEAKGHKLSALNLNSLGRAEKVTIGRVDCSIIGGYGNQDAIKERVQMITEEMKTATGGDLEFLKQRISYLTGMSAVVEVGGQNELEIGEKKDRIDDAVCATRAAIMEGYVPGGGTALLSISQYVKSDNNSDIVINAIKEPYKQCMRNAGLSDKDVQYDQNCGTDVTTGEVVDMIEKGIIDPAKVVRVAVENAASVAISFLTTECVVYGEYTKE